MYPVGKGKGRFLQKRAGSPSECADGNGSSPVPDSQEAPSDSESENDIIIQIQPRSPASVPATKAARIAFLKSLCDDPRLLTVVDAWVQAHVGYVKKSHRFIKLTPYRVIT